MTEQSICLVVATRSFLRDERLSAGEIDGRVVWHSAAGPSQ